MDFVRYMDDNGNTAMYLNGELEVTGDDTTCYLFLSDFFGIEERIGSEFYLGRKQEPRNVAVTLAEIDEYAAQKSESRKEILTKIQYRFMQIESLYEEIETLRGMLHE